MAVTINRETNLIIDRDSGITISRVGDPITIVVGADGSPGKGVPVGGSSGQVLSKIDATDFNTEWADVDAVGISDHGLLTGLADDDHPQYAKVAGATFTGDVSIGDTVIKADSSTVFLAPWTQTQAAALAELNAIAPTPGRYVLGDGTTLARSNEYVGPGGPFSVVSAVQAKGDSFVTWDYTNHRGIWTGTNGHNFYTSVGGGVPTLKSTFSIFQALLPGDPTEPLQAATKQYVDDAASGIITDHGLLTGLADDDHPQYPSATGQPAAQIAQTDGADGWTFIDTPTGGGFSRDGSWWYSSTVGSAPPTRMFTLDNATPASTTWVRFSDTDLNNVDHTEFMVQLLSDSSVLLLQHETNDSVWATFSVTGTPTDGGTYVEVPVSLSNESGNWPPQNNDRILVNIAISTGGGVADHGALTGLADDDHAQYHTDARGDARYYTQGQVDTALAGKSDTGHTHDGADIASGTVDIAHIPTGTTGTTVALGNHLHTGVYDPAGTAASAVAAHEGAADPHAQYLTAAEGNAAYEASGAVTAHEALSDPHAQYLQPSEVLAGSNITVDTTTTPGSVIINQSGGGVTDHGALTGLADDDHPQYVKKSGDTMTGNLTIDATGTASIIMDKGAASNYAQFEYHTAGSRTWAVSVYPSTNLTIARNGAVGIVCDWDEATGQMSIYKDPTADAHVAHKGYVDASLAGKVNQDSTYATAIGTIMRLTQAQYDAIGTPSDSVLYVIVG